MIAYRDEVLNTSSNCKEMTILSFKKTLLTCILATVAASPGAQRMEGSSADELVSAGLEALRQIDEDRAGELWDVTSAFVKTAKPRDQFVSEVHQARSTVGRVIQRTWANVTRIRYEDGSVTPPPGLYANVDYSTRLADGRTVFEKVSFRLEPAGWRLVGYEPRQNQGQ